MDSNIVDLCGKIHNSRIYTIFQAPHSINSLPLCRLILAVQSMPGFKCLLLQTLSTLALLLKNIF